MFWNGFKKKKKKQPFKVFHLSRPVITESTNDCVITTSLGLPFKFVLFISFCALTPSYHAVFQMKRKLDHGPEVRPFPSGKKPCPRWKKKRLKCWMWSFRKHLHSSPIKAVFLSDSIHFFLDDNIQAFPSVSQSDGFGPVSIHSHYFWRLESC